MAVHQKLSEIGWFYHAPKRRIAMDPVLAPPPSQIPGLSDVSQIPEEAPPRSVFRDTDTKYVRLAKMGGRPGLLHMKEYTPKSTDAQPYQRNNWFYLEDNAAEDAAAKANAETWVFRLPEYMVHDEFKPNWPDGVPPAHNNKGSERGDAAEAKAKSAGAAQQQAMLLRGDHYERAKKLQEEALRSKYTVPPPLYDQRDRPIMNKLMSYGYVNDWKKVRDDWYTVEQTRKNAEEKEKAEQAAPTAHAAAPVAGGRPDKQKRGLPKLLKSRKTKDEEVEKEPFKLTRFSNVQAKVTTHRNAPELPAAVS